MEQCLIILMTIVLIGSLREFKGEIMISKKFFVLLFVLAFLALSSFAYEKLNWKSRAMTAGKASLTSNSYRVVCELGAPNFSPELRFPL